MPLAKEKFWIFLTILFYLQTLKAGEDTHTSDVTINSDTTNQQTIDDGGDNVTLTNNATINNGDDNGSVQSADNLSGVTVINNIGGIIKQEGAFDGTVIAERNTNFTLINSGTIESNDGQAVNIKLTTDAVITNNAGGSITAKRNTIRCTASCTSPTIHNFGKISARQEYNIRVPKY